MSEGMRTPNTCATTFTYCSSVILHRRAGAKEAVLEHGPGVAEPLVPVTGEVPEPPEVVPFAPVVCPPAVPEPVELTFEPGGPMMLPVQPPAAARARAPTATRPIPSLLAMRNLLFGASSEIGSSHRKAAQRPSAKMTCSETSVFWFWSATVQLTAGSAPNRVYVTIPLPVPSQVHGGMPSPPFTSQTPPP